MDGCIFSFGVDITINIKQGQTVETIMNYYYNFTLFGSMFLGSTMVVALNDSLLVLLTCHSYKLPAYFNRPPYMHYSRAMQFTRKYFATILKCESLLQIYHRGV